MKLKSRTVFLFILLISAGPAFALPTYQAGGGAPSVNAIPSVPSVNAILSTGISSGYQHCGFTISATPVTVTEDRSFYITNAWMGGTADWDEQINFNATLNGSTVVSQTAGWSKGCDSHASAGSGYLGYFPVTVNGQTDNDTITFNLSATEERDEYSSSNVTHGSVSYGYTKNYCAGGQYTKNNTCVWIDGNIGAYANGQQATAGASYYGGNNATLSCTEPCNVSLNWSTIALGGYVNKNSNTPGPSNWSPGNSPSGSATDSLTAGSYRYDVFALDGYGNPYDQATISVNVLAASPGPTATFTATPATVSLSPTSPPSAGTVTVSNTPATNGGTFTINCNIVPNSSTFPSGIVIIPSGCSNTSVGANSSVPVTISPSSTPPPGTYSATLNIQATPVGNTTLTTTNNQSVQITYNSAPVAPTCQTGGICVGNLTASSNNIQPGQAVTLTVTSDPFGLTFYWAGTDNGTDIGNVPGGTTNNSYTYTINTPGTYTRWAKIYGPNNSLYTTSAQTITVGNSGGGNQGNTPQYYYQVNAATDAKQVSHTYQCGSHPDQSCIVTYQCGGTATDFFGRPYCTEFDAVYNCRDITVADYCTANTYPGSWGSSVHGSAPINNVSLQFSLNFSNLLQYNNDTIQFSCKNDGTWDYSHSYKSQDDLTAINVCNYPSPGSYTARGRIINPIGQTEWCRNGNCDAVVPILASAPVVNGSCGSANKTYLAGSTSYGSDSYCSSGAPDSTPSFPAPGTSVSWICDGSGGGSNSGQCTASNPGINGSCGTANKTYPSTATSYGSDTYCSTGTPSTQPAFPAPGTSANWKCNSTSGGSSSGQCTAYVTPVNGVPGTANKTYPAGTTSYGSDTFCASGTVSPSNPPFPSPGQPVTWTCNGSVGGSSSTGTASVIASQFSLTITNPSSNGTVTSSDSHINCGSTCSYNYTQGSSVTLHAAPASSYWRFSNWAGDCSGTGDCSLIVNGTKRIQAIFSPRAFNYQEF